MIEFDGKNYFVYIDTKTTTDFYIGRFTTKKQANDALKQALKENR